MLFETQSKQKDQHASISGPEIETKKPERCIIGYFSYYGLALLIGLALYTICSYVYGCVDLFKDPTPPTVSQVYTPECERASDQQYCGIVHLVDKDGNAIADAYYAPGSTKSVTVSNDLYEPYEYANGHSATFDFPNFYEHHLEHIHVYSDYPVKDRAIYSAETLYETPESHYECTGATNDYHFVCEATAGVCEYQPEDPCDTPKHNNSDHTQNPAHDPIANIGGGRTHDNTPLLFQSPQQPVGESKTN